MFHLLRPKRPADKMANKQLFLHAIAEAQKSVSGPIKTKVPEMEVSYFLFIGGNSMQSGYGTYIWRVINILMSLQSKTLRKRLRRGLVEPDPHSASDAYNVVGESL